MRRFLWVLTIVALAGTPTFAEEGERSAEALKILEKVDAAAKAVNSVRFTMTIERTGAAETLPGPEESDVVMSGWTGGVPQKFLIRVKGKRPGAEEPVEILAGGNGDMFFLIDHGTNKAYEDMDPGVMGSNGPLLFGAIMIEFVHETPFTDELNGERVELLGTETIDGVECHKIDVFYEGGRGHSTWLVSKDDFLPRRRIQHITTQEGEEGTIERTIHGLEIEPELDDALFVLKLPEGYEQIDDFAP